jgi:hypothetical protein
MSETTIAQNRLHRAVSALAYQMLADGKVDAFEYACAHQAPHWINTRLTPQRALEKSLEGFRKTRPDKKLIPGEREAAAHQARFLSRPAPWDESALKAEQEARQ